MNKNRCCLLKQLNNRIKITFHEFKTIHQISFLTIPWVNNHLKIIVWCQGIALRIVEIIVEEWITRIIVLSWVNKEEITLKADYIKVMEAEMEVVVAITVAYVPFIVGIYKTKILLIKVGFYRLPMHPCVRMLIGQWTMINHSSRYFKIKDNSNSNNIEIQWGYQDFLLYLVMYAKL